MADINSVTLVGRLVRDGELKYSQNGQAILRFSIAINRAKRTADGKWEDESNFFDCVYFGRAAESVSPYLEKGRQVALAGELHQSRWESNDGQARSRVEIYVNNLSLVGGQSSNSQQPRQAQQPQSQGMRPTGGYSRPQSQSPQQDYNNGSYSGGPEDFQDDSIPF